MEYLDIGVFQGEEFYLSQFVKFVKSCMPLITDESCHQLFSSEKRTAIKRLKSDTCENMCASAYGEIYWLNLIVLCKKGQKESSKKINAVWEPT